MWNELTFLWNELTILWNDLTTDWNDLTWNDLTMGRNDRIPFQRCSCISSLGYLCGDYFSHTDPFYFRQPLQSLLLRYAAENLRVT